MQYHGFYHRCLAGRQMLIALLSCLSKRCLKFKAAALQSRPRGNYLQCSLANFVEIILIFMALCLYTRDSEGMLRYRLHCSIHVWPAYAHL